jgi:hypothetical protein
MIALGLVGLTVLAGLVAVGGNADGSLVRRLAGATPSPATVFGQPLTPSRPSAIDPPAGPVRPTATPAPGERELGRLSEAALTELCRRYLTQPYDGLSLTNPQARITHEYIIISGRLSGLLLPLDLTAYGRVEFHQGRPRVLLDRLDGGGLPIPPPITAQLDAWLARVDLLANQPTIDLTRIELTDGQLILYGRPRR